MARLIEHFWRQLGDTAAETGGLGVVVDFLLGQPEVSQLGVSLFVQHHVVGFKVALDDVVRVQVFDCQQDFGDVELGRVFVEFFKFVQDLSQIPTGTILHDQE